MALICGAIFVHMWEWHLRGLVYASKAPDDFACLSWPEAMGSGAAPVAMAYHYVHVWGLRGLSAKGHTLWVVGILITKPKNISNFLPQTLDHARHFQSVPLLLGRAQRDVQHPCVVLALTLLLHCLWLHRHHRCTCRNYICKIHQFISCKFFFF